MLTVPEIEARLGSPLFVHQIEALEDAAQQHTQGSQVRLCLYHRTGAGKTRTALAVAAVAGAQHVLVVTPPAARPNWEQDAQRLGLTVDVISHAKFRQKEFKVRRDQAMIVDEFHLLGGHTGQGWRKMDRLAQGLQAPLVIASATPNYNDAERVYCIQHVLDPHSCKGGYLQFVYDHCITEVNPFGTMPLVVGFRHHRDAEHYLMELPKVHYVEDEVIKRVTIGELIVADHTPDTLYRVGLDERRRRVCASRMEKDHAITRHQLVGDDGLIRPHVYEEISVQVGQVSTPSLVYFNHAEIAEAMLATCVANGAKALLVTGKDTYASKLEKIELFKSGEFDVLIGTATLATGTDGLDKMCNQLIIVDDTQDDALRRQLMGRILPRGADSDVSQKVFTRIVVF